MSYWIWIPLSIIILFFSAWFSVRSNQCNNGNWTTYLWLYNLVISIIPIWPLIAKNSKNLVFDSLLYDTVYLVAYTISLAYLTNFIDTVKYINIIGVIIIIVGFILMKL